MFSEADLEGTWGSRGWLEHPSGPKLFHFHGEFQEVCVKLWKMNTPFLHLNPLFRNPGSAPGFFVIPIH